MKFYRNAIILVIIVALLAGAYILAGKIKSKSTDDAGNDLIKLTDYTSDKVESLTLENPDGTFLIVKKDNDWVLSEPKDLKYDTSVLSSIVINAASITADRVIEENAQDLAKYGLDKPIFVTLKDKEGKVTVIEVGDKTPTESGYYVKLADKGDVYIISTYTGDYLVKGRNEMRSKALFDFSSDIINKLSMKRNGQNVFKAVREKDSITSWTMTEPIKGSMNDTALSPMLDALAKATVVEFLKEDTSDLSKYGLDNPAYEFEFGTTTAGAFKILLGDEKVKNSEIYAKFDVGEEVFVLDSTPFNFLDKPLKEIVSVFAYIVNIDQVKEIKLTMDGKTTNMKLDVYKDAEGKMDADKDKFYVDGIDASGKDEKGDQPFRKFYQALIGVSLDEVDTAGMPSGNAEITIEYTLKDGSMKVEFIPKDENYYYVVRNGEYAGILVKKNKKDYGIIGLKESYKTLMDFLASQKK